MSKNSQKFDAAIRSLTETTDSLLLLGGLFQLFQCELIFDKKDLHGMGALLLTHARRLKKATSRVSLTKERPAQAAKNQS